MAERLLDFAWSLGRWAYALVFLVAALEASAFIGLLVPGETLTVSAGFLASAGVLNLAPTIVAAALEAIAGDSIGYEMGRRLGRAWLMRHGLRFGFGQSRLDRIEALFGRYGGLTIFLARFVGFLRALAPFVAGAARMTYRQFLFFNIAGGWAWACTFVLVGLFPRRVVVDRGAVGGPGGIDCGGRGCCRRAILVPAAAADAERRSPS